MEPGWVQQPQGNCTQEKYGETRYIRDPDKVGQRKPDFIYG